MKCFNSPEDLTTFSTFTVLYTSWSSHEVTEA